MDSIFQLLPWLITMVVLMACSGFFSPEAAELGIAIDQYKLTNSRRYITHEEMIQVIKSIGYAKS
ncbi:hypothetical protein N9099_02540 [Mariniblastus sp.]|nr:hypothetical protein [Mariniblastus sp.]